MKFQLRLIDDQEANNRLTIASLRTEINGWQERHSTLVQIRNKQEQQYFNVLTVNFSINFIIRSSSAKFFLRNYVN